MSKLSQSSISFQCRIYKIEQRPTIWKCFFECYHDDKCDYFVDVHSYCCYGDFQHTGGPAVTWSNDVTVYVKNGKSVFQINECHTGPDMSIDQKYHFYFRKKTRYFLHHYLL